MSVKEKIKNVIKEHNLMHIATIGLDGAPRVRGVDYAVGESDNILYFITHKATNKVAEFENNEKVSVVIDHDCPGMEELLKLVYLKANGIATVIRQPEKIQEIFGRVIQKFPYLKDLPGNPNDFVGVRVELKEVFLTDNTIGFGNTENVTY